MDKPQRQVADGSNDCAKVTHSGGLVNVTVERPIDIERAQADVWRALRAGLVAAGLVGSSITLTVLADGSLVGTVCGAYHGWSQDPMLDSHVETLAAVADAAMESYGYPEAT